MPAEVTPELFKQIEIQASRVMRAVEAPAEPDQHAREMLQLTAGPLVALVSFFALLTMQTAEYKMSVII